MQNEKDTLILVDFSNFTKKLALGTYAHMKEFYSLESMRHLILYNLLKLNKEYKNSEIVLCLDNYKSNYWRKDFYSNYKIMRGKSRSNSDFSFDELNEFLVIIRSELIENAPFIHMDVEKCEADDIIAVLTKNNQNYKKILVLSTDGDFDQLKKYPNYSRINLNSDYRFDEVTDEYDIYTHILKGDGGDSIPNFYTSDDFFYKKFNDLPITRQKSVTSKMIDLVRKAGGLSADSDENLKKNYQRNKTLVDFDEIPLEIQERISKEYEDRNNDLIQNNVFEYCLTNNLNECLKIL